jgi:hypothetical protein
MRKMKGSGSYLKNQVRKNLAKAALCLFLFILILVAAGLQTFFTMDLSLPVEVVLLLSLVPLGVSYFYLRKYHIYRVGWEGEKQVTRLLTRSLSDDYLLLNDLYLKGGAGDIDHVILAPGGVFVLETKNWSGTVACNGDSWSRVGRKDFRGSPSLQAKRGAATLKRIVDSSPSLHQLGIWVEPVVVFTNNHATLHLNSPTVTVLKLPQLSSYITRQGDQKRYSREQLEAVGTEILNQKR